MDQSRASDDGRLGLLIKAMRAFAEATLDEQRLVRAIARSAAEVIGDHATVLLCSSDGVGLVPAAIHTADPEMLARTRTLFEEPLVLATHHAARGVLETGVSVRVVLDDLARYETTPRYASFVREVGMHGLLLVALRVLDRPIGLLSIIRYRPTSPAFDARDAELAESLAAHAALAIANARAYAGERAARSRFGRLVESNLIGILVANVDGTVHEINDALLAMVGRSREDILSGRVPWASLTPPEWREVDARAIAQLAASGIAARREKGYVHADGHRVPVMCGSAMLEGTGDAISFVLDLTESKAEQHRVHLAAIVEASDDAIIGKSLDGTITSWNSGARRLFGYAAGEMIGHSIMELVPPGREGEEQAILETLAAGEVQRFETLRRRKDGREVEVSVTASPVRDATGRITGIAKVARDITELARAKAAVEAANLELEAFSYSVAHDLRAPLRGIRSFAQMLLEDYRAQLDAQGQDWLDEIGRSAQRMGALIDALLSLSKVSRRPLRCETIDLAALVRETAAALAAAEPERDVAWVVADELRAALDPVLARALLANLLGNAWKFTAHTPAPTIEVGRLEAGGFFVRDNGAGFAMAYAHKLFTPFQRLHSAKEFAGTGIGLAIVQRIVARHGGRIWAEGAVGRGASFFVTLPEATP